MQMDWWEWCQLRLTVAENEKCRFFEAKWVCKISGVYDELVLGPPSCFPAFNVLAEPERDRETGGPDLIKRQIMEGTGS